MNLKKIDYEVSVCFRCHKEFADSEINRNNYCLACRTFGNRSNYYLIVTGFLFYFCANLVDVVCDFTRLNFNHNPIFLVFYFFSFLYFLAGCFRIFYFYRKVGKKL